MNILDYGAIPDDETDNKPVIQEMLGKGFDIEIPKTDKPFFVSDTLYVSSKTRTTISGRGTLRFNGVRGITINGNHGVQSEDCLIEGVTIDGCTEAIFIKGTQRTKIRDCVIRNFSQCGVSVHGHSFNHDVSVESCLIETNIVDNDAAGVELFSVDSFCRNNIIIGAAYGVVVNAPACDVIGNHIFPGVGGGLLKIAIKLEELGNSLILLCNNYLDNARESFISINNDKNNSILIMGNKFLKRDSPTAQWIAGPTVGHNNVYVDSSSS